MKQCKLERWYERAMSDGAAWKDGRPVSPREDRRAARRWQRRHDHAAPAGWEWDDTLAF